MKRLLLVCTLVLAAGLTFTACGGGKGPDTGTAPSADFPDPASGSAPAAPAQQVQGAGICEGKPTYQSADGTLKFCVLESNLEELDGRCVTVEFGKTYTHKVGIISATKGYLRNAQYGSPENNCGATGDQPSSGPLDKAEFPAGESSMTFTWTFNDRFCGRKQDDTKAVNATGQVEGLTHHVFNSPKPCANCEEANGRFESVNQDGSTVTLTPKFKNEVGGVKVSATVYWGDGTSTENVQAGTVLTHSYPAQPKKSYHISLKLKIGELECDPGLDITVGNDPSCKDYTAPEFGGELGITLATNTATITSGTVSPSGGSFSPAVPAEVPRPPYNSEEAVNFTTNYTVSYGPENLRCTASHSYSKTVPPKEPTCEDFQVPSTSCTPDVTTTASQVTVNSIACTPYGVSFTPAPPQSKNRPAYGQSADSLEFDGTYGYSPTEGLRCSAPKHVSVPVPPKEQNCEEANPNYGDVNGDGSKSVTGSYSETEYWRMNQGNDNARENACVNRGGVWLNDYNVPNDGTGDLRPDVCRFTYTYPATNPPGAPGNDMTLYNPPGTVQSGGLSLTVSSSWSVAPGKAQTLTFEIVYVPSNFVKKSKNQTFECGQGGQGSLTWGPGDQYNSSPNYSPGDGHITGTYTLRIKRGATVVANIPLP